MEHPPAETAPAPIRPRERTERVSAVVAALVMTGFCVTLVVVWPWQGAIPPIVAAVVAYVAWLKTNYAHPVRSRRVIAAYLCAVAFQLIHMSEEYLAGFPHDFADLFDTSQDWTEKSFLLAAVFYMSAVLCLAGAGALYQIRVANYALWFYALGLGLVNAIAHFVLPFLEGGYFPGLYTAFGHFVMSVLLIYFLVQESRRLKAEAATGPAAA
ncbi:HXXEE domain-containing protein [Streptomyces sp. 184]|uniref:HXXEE domain-containing protein n=1 Tax=Streptomyces sp. 184 TaxID=1827526 RepID=UPI0038927001